MEEDLEDGEVLDTGDDGVIVSQSSNVETAHMTSAKPRDKSCAVGQSMMSNKSENSIPFPGSEGSKCLKNLMKLKSDSDSDSDCEGILHSDDDDEDVRPAKRQAILSQTSNYQPSVAQEVSITIDGRKRTKNRNNIWGSVLSEQTLSKEIGSWGVNKKVESDRDVETYDYIAAQKLKKQQDDETVNIPRDGSGEPAHDGRDIFDCSAEPGSAQLDDIETFGTGPVRRPPCRETPDIIEHLERDLDGHENIDGERLKGDRRIWRKDVYVNNKIKSRLGAAGLVSGELEGGKRTVKERLGTRSYDETKDRSHIKVKVADSSDDVTLEIMRVLNEPPGMKDTFSRVVETIGAEEALKYLYITEDLEEAGGLMILNGERRRTPGGVYLFLVKTDLPRDISNQIFEFQSNGSTNQKRRREDKKRRQRHLEERMYMRDEFSGTSCPSPSSPSTPAYQSAMNECLGTSGDPNAANSAPLDDNSLEFSSETAVAIDIL